MKGDVVWSRSRENVRGEDVLKSTLGMLATDCVLLCTEYVGHVETVMCDFDSPVPCPWVLVEGRVTLSQDEGTGKSRPARAGA